MDPVLNRTFANKRDCLQKERVHLWRRAKPPGVFLFNGEAACAGGSIGGQLTRTLYDSLPAQKWAFFEAAELKEARFLLNHLGSNFP